MAQYSLQAVRGALSATSEYLPKHAASQAKFFVMEQMPKAASAIAHSAKDNPSTAAGVVLAATGLTVLAAPAIVSAPALLVSGFSSTGVGAVAAAAQSGIGNVAAGSIFATLQSAGAGGAGLAVVNGAVQIGGGLMTIVGSGLVFLKSKL